MDTFIGRKKTMCLICSEDCHHRNDEVIFFFGHFNGLSCSDLVKFQAQFDIEYKEKILGF